MSSVAFAFTASTSSNLFPFNVDLIFGNEKKSHGARSGEYGGCSNTGTVPNPAANLSLAATRVAAVHLRPTTIQFTFRSTHNAFLFSLPHPVCATSCFCVYACLLYFSTLIWFRIWCGLLHNTKPGWRHVQTYCTYVFYYLQLLRLVFRQKRLDRQGVVCRRVVLVKNPWAVLPHFKSFLLTRSRSFVKTSL